MKTGIGLSAGPQSSSLIPHPSSRPRLFFDLDGPLLDVRMRYHGVYTAIAGELGVPALGMEEYWAAKRQREPLRAFFPHYSDETRLAAEYRERWLAWIEAPEWLTRDRLVPGAGECLERLGRSCRLYLVTLRQQPAALARQLDGLDLPRFFEGVYSGWAEGAGAARLKAGWMRPLLAGNRGMIVGDTEVDMQAATLLGMRAIGVSFGIREPRELIALGAERVIDDLGELAGLLDSEECVAGQGFRS